MRYFLKTIGSPNWASKAVFTLLVFVHVCLAGLTSNLDVMTSTRVSPAMCTHFKTAYLTVQKHVICPALTIAMPTCVLIIVYDGKKSVSQNGVEGLRKNILLLESG